MRRVPYVLRTSTDHGWNRVQSSSDEETLAVVKTEDILGGDPRIEGHRIGVYHVYQRYEDGDDTPEAIATRYDLSVAEVHTALAYAFSHPEEMCTMRLGIG